MTDDWNDRTQVGFVFEQRKDVRVFRVQTRSSSYVLGFFGVGGSRPFAIMRGVSATMGHGVDLRDGDPRIGDQPLFPTPIDQWVGKRIDMAGTTTSPVADVVEETTSEHSQTLVRTLMQTARPQPAVQAHATPMPAANAKQARTEESRETPYPENCVKYVEALASVLRTLASNGETIRDIRGFPQLLARLKVAVMNARVASEDVARLLQ